MGKLSFEQITVCLDMYGCPNRCKHCWLGITPNGNLSIDDLIFVSEQFRPFTDNLEVSDRYREEDFKDNYKELWRVTTELSDRKTPHFENISYWRAVRDSEYIPWLSAIGLKNAQLTIFGDEETTDYYVGRKGAFQEIMETIEILLQYKIAPRIQSFIYKNNIDQLPYILHLIEKLKLEKRCAEMGRCFSFFLHQGSCDGENEQFYNVWITSDDIDKIPVKLIEFTLKHFGKSNIREVLGEPEKILFEQLIVDNSTENIVTDKPVFYIDKDYNVYPNYETPSSYWCLGNLKDIGAEKILMNYVNNKSIAQNAKQTVPTGKMVAKHGNPDSLRLFGQWDYKNYILNKYCKAL
jgi:MoaA/NifB/PqqE/SkfB family radical SAM enzyme